MLFLIEYDRARGRLVSLRRYPDTQRRQAEDCRIEREVELNRLRIEREVVLLEAETESKLRITHRRYFEDLAELANSPAA